MSNSNETHPYDFNQWETRAAEETQKVIEAHDQGQSLTFKSDIWTRLKLHLFEIFHGKCAYCESKVLHVASGDVEHYRPKKRVDDDNTHSGYYWLAYNKNNLLPCCEKCNRVRGKRNHFPIAGQRAYAPNEALNVEDPLMLNPYKDNPKEHLSFPPGIVTQGKLTCVGTVEGITSQGKRTIEICNLRRPPLIEERRSEQERFVNDLLLAATRLNEAKVVSIWLDVLRGVRPYSAAALAQCAVLERFGIVCPPEIRDMATMAPACAVSEVD